MTLDSKSHTLVKVSLIKANHLNCHGFMFYLKLFKGFGNTECLEVTKAHSCLFVSNELELLKLLKK